MKLDRHIRIALRPSSAASRGREKLRKLGLVPNLERLEVRITPTTKTWSGAIDNIWTRAANWSGDVAPVAGDDLVFPDTASRLTTANDLDVGTNFGSITVGAAGYFITGNAITVTNGVSSTYATGSSTFAPNIALSATETVDVATGGTLVLSGVVSGSGFGVTKTGGGTLDFTGSGANTDSGTTTVNAGTLGLGKSTGVNAFAGNLVVGDNSGTGDSVTLLASNQIPNGSVVTVNEGATFDLDGQSDTIAGLTLQGGTVNVPTGSTLTLNSSITTIASTNHVMSVIQGAGDLDLNQASAQSFNLTIADDANLDVDFRISTAVATNNTNAYINKDGAGTAALSGTNTFGDTITLYSYAGVVQLESSGALGGAVANADTGGRFTFSGTNLSFAGDFYTLALANGANV